jgi:hypothetical protein
MNRKICWLIVLSLVFTLPVSSGDSYKPGEYIPEGGWGTLTIKVAAGKTHFEITAVGGNFHTCGLSGEIKNGQAKLEALDKACIVTFTKRGSHIDVTQSGEECLYYCGARAAFEGLYLEPPAGCDRQTKAKTRASFKRMYEKKEYKPALDLLSGLFRSCGKGIDWIETGWIKNDIAITQYKLGDSAACKATLSSFAEEAKLSDDEIRDRYPPSDAEVWLPVAKAAKFNLKLCSGKPAGK